MMQFTQLRQRTLKQKVMKSSRQKKTELAQTQQEDKLSDMKGQEAQRPIDSIRVACHMSQLHTKTRGIRKSVIEFDPSRGICHSLK